MNFSKRSRYGIRALIDLAQAGDGGCTQLSDIAARNHIPAKYLEQIFIALRKAGILGSVKGPQGGYFLEDNPQKLRIADIVYTIAPAVSKGNQTLLDWINEEIQTLGKKQFFHADYDATLADTYGEEYKEELVVEGGTVDEK